MEGAASELDQRGWRGAKNGVLLGVTFTAIALGLGQLHLASDGIEALEELSRDFGRAFFALALVFLIAGMIHRTLQRRLVSLRETWLIKKFFNPLYNKRPSHWLVVTSLIVIGIHIGHWLHE